MYLSGLLKETEAERHRELYVVFLEVFEQTFKREAARHDEFTLSFWKYLSRFSKQRQRHMLLVHYNF
jgi:hypothetical protein